jgi:hypothetical protein
MFQILTARSEAVNDRVKVQRLRIPRCALVQAGLLILPFNASTPQGVCASAMNAAFSASQGTNCRVTGMNTIRSQYFELYPNLRETSSDNCQWHSPIE